MHKKVAFIGSVGSGKTTIINELSSIETVNTDVESSVDIGKDLTTVGIDYGHITLGEGMSIGLYGVPGQRRFSFVWDHVNEGLWAIVLLLKHDDESSLEEMENLIDHFNIDNTTACIIGLTHSEGQENSPFTDTVKALLTKKGLTLPVFHIDARSKGNALMMMHTLIAMKEMNES